MSHDDFSDEDDDDGPISQSISSASSPKSNFGASLRSQGGFIEGTPIFPTDQRDDSRYFGKIDSTAHVIKKTVQTNSRIGTSCSMSILSRTGIEWIKSKAGDVSFLRMISPESRHENPWNQWRPDVFQDLFASKVFKPLPSRSEVFSLIKDFFRTANRLFPIYLESSFMKMVEWQYTQQTCDDAARWANINMVICLAYEYRSSSSSKSEKDKEKSELYFKNAMSVFTELALKRTDLLSIQALLSMVRLLLLWHLWKHLTILQRRSSFGEMREPNQHCRSLLQPCAPVTEWDFIEIFQDRNLVRLSKRRDGAFFGLHLSLTKGKRSPFRRRIKY